MDKESILKLLEQFKTQDSTENGIETLPLIMEWDFDDLADALVKLCALDSVSNNEAESEVAFCDSPIHDFDRCPFIVQRNDCKDCRYYN